MATIPRIEANPSLSMERMRQRGSTATPTQAMIADSCVVVARASVPLLPWAMKGPIILLITMRYATPVKKVSCVASWEVGRME